jgi:hypothetical protein
MVGQLEPVLERTPGNAAMQVGIGRSLLLLAGDRQQVRLEGDVEIEIR